MMARKRPKLARSGAKSADWFGADVPVPFRVEAFVQFTASCVRVTIILRFFVWG
jgi:hypothetical protein